MKQDENRRGKNNCIEDLNLEPIEKLVVIDQIIERITCLIQDGMLVPGGSLPGERMLAEKLKVSRPSVRQALRALSLLGVLDIQPGVGTFVRSEASKLLTNPLKFMRLIEKIEDIELLEARETIEPELARLAAIRASENDLEIMRAMLEQARGYLRAPREYLRCEFEFHKAIWNASGNRVMAAMMTSVTGLLQGLREKTVLLFKDLNESLEDHVRIMEAIESGDPNRAKEAMVTHLKDLKNRVQEGEQG